MTGRLSSSTRWLRGHYRPTPKTERMDSVPEPVSASSNRIAESPGLFSELVVCVLALCILAMLSGSVSILLRMLLRQMI
jgi:hypothetical protein